MTSEVQQQLQQLFRDGACPKLLDTRIHAEYLCCRLKYSVNIELPKLTSNCFLLPDKHTPFAVVVPDQSTCSVTQEASLHNKCLADKSTAVYLKGTGSIQEFLTSRGWTVTHFLQDSAILWSTAKELGLTEEQPADSATLATRCLFAPSGLLSSTIDDIEDGLIARQLSRFQQQQQLNVNQQQTGAHMARLVLSCLDVGCGSGRDMAWLASRQHVREVPGCQNHSDHGQSHQQQHHDQQRHKLPTLIAGQRVLVSWHVTGVDEWLGALERAHDLAAALQLTPQHVQLVYGGVNRNTGDIHLLKLPSTSKLLVATHAAVVHHASTTPTAAAAVAESQDLVKEHDAVQQQHSEAAFTDTGTTATVDKKVWMGSYDVVLCVRFLERSLLPRLRYMLSPGGYILYSTFVDGPGLKAFGRPSGPDHVLQPGELARDYFGPNQGFTVLQDRVELTADGREVCCFIARLQG